MAGRHAAGSELLIRYAGVAPVEHHARLVLAPIGGDGANHDHYFIITPTGINMPKTMGQEIATFIQLLLDHLIAAFHLPSRAPVSMTLQPCQPRTR